MKNPIVITTTPRVLFVLKYRDQPYDSSASWGDGSGKFLSSGLYNSARFVSDMLASKGIVTKLVHVIDNNHIHREIVEFNATHVVIEAFWVVPPKFEELHRVCPNVQFIIRNHSEAPFLANEGIGFEWMLDYVTYKNVVMSANSSRMTRETRLLVETRFPTWSQNKIEEKTPYLPNFYPTDRKSMSPIDQTKCHVDVGCFGAIRPLKNHVEQAIAAIRFAQMINKPLRFHINSGRIEGNGSPILKNLVKIFERMPNAELVCHPWKGHSDFKTLVATMDIMTQTSYSETFNIVAADATIVGVPVIGSGEIMWLDERYVANPNDSANIADIMLFAYEMKCDYPSFNPNLKGLRRYNDESVGIWLAYFDECTKQKKGKDKRKHWWNIF